MSTENRKDRQPEQAIATGGSGGAGRFPKGRSGNPKGRPRKDAEKRFDGWTSLLTGIGTMSRDKTVSTRFEIDVVDWETAQMIYRGDPLGARIVETKANELVREGYELCITDDGTHDSPEDEDDAPDKAPVAGNRRVEDEVLEHRRVFKGRRTAGLDKVGKELAEEVEHKWEELELLNTIHEALCYEAAYGGAAILIGADDGAASLEEPLVMKRVKGVSFLTALEPRE